MENRERIKAVTRLIVTALLIINSILTAKGHSPLPWDESTLMQGVYDALAALATIWVWWKNNNITHAAITAQQIKDGIKTLEMVPGGEPTEDILEDPEEEEEEVEE